ncbi:MAG: hypothetical protein IID37_07930 [Planctomycetes bacterium]|nr:hypothetical protein [Planctomycetota bacterium]
MGTCFVIQPFDDGKFDKRYEDVFSPAVCAAGLKPYRVDRDPSVSIPIEDIQSGIQASDVCLADISTDNPNVWFELGYAIAAQREVVLVCSDERASRFPFDVQHRSIIRYSTESSSDFEKLREKIESRIKATLQRREKLGQVARIQSVAKVEGLAQHQLATLDVEGLAQHQLATLVSVAERLDAPNDSISAYQIRQAMESAGFTALATTLGLRALLDIGMLESFEDSDYQGETFIAYRVTNSGMTWLLENQASLNLIQEIRTAADELDSPF